MQVASNVGNLASKFGHARPLRTGIICYVRDGRTPDKKTDGQTDGRTKATLTVPFPTVGGVISLTSENKGSIITPSFNEIG